MCSIHANSAREAVTKLATLPLLAGENVSYRFTTPTIASCVDVVVHLAKGAGGRRRVTEVVGLSGRVEGEVIEVSQVFATQDGRLLRADGFPPHAERYLEAGYDLARLLLPPVASLAAV